jgi:hypothetical protein
MWGEGEKKEEQGAKEIEKEWIRGGYAAGAGSFFTSPLPPQPSLTHLEQGQGSISALELRFGQREEGKLARQRNYHQQHCC